MLHTIRYKKIVVPKIPPGVRVRVRVRGAGSIVSSRSKIQLLERMKNCSNQS